LLAKISHLFTQERRFSSFAPGGLQPRALRPLARFICNFKAGVATPVRLYILRCRMKNGFNKRIFLSDVGHEIAQQSSTEK
jgi:hypothetical protein